MSIRMRPVIAAIFLALFGVTTLLSAATPAWAQTHAERVDMLFAELKAAPDAEAARRIANGIWELWTHPDDPELAAAMAEVSLKMGQSDLQGAIALLDDIVAGHPDYAEGWNQRATIHFFLGNYEQSLADIDATLLCEPRHFGALAGRALIQLELGHRDLALEAVRQALEFHPFLSERALFPELGDGMAI